MLLGEYFEAITAYQSSSYPRSMAACFQAQGDSDNADKQVTLALELKPDSCLRVYADNLLYRRDEDREQHVELLHATMGRKRPKPRI